MAEGSLNSEMLAGRNSDEKQISWKKKTSFHAHQVESVNCA